MPPMSEDLKKSVSEYIKAWRSMSHFYACVSIALRGTLIITSALVAAKVGSGKGASIQLLSDFWTAVLGVYVAAATALDSWLKPREKWKGFMTDCENAEDLFMCLDNTDSKDGARIDEFRAEFRRIVETHREKNVF